MNIKHNIVIGEIYNNLKVVEDIGYKTISNKIQTCRRRFYKCLCLANIFHMLNDKIANKNIAEIMHLVDEDLKLIGFMANGINDQTYEAADLQKKKFRAEICAFIADRIMEMR